MIKSLKNGLEDSLNKNQVQFCKCLFEEEEKEDY